MAVGKQTKLVLLGLLALVILLGLALYPKGEPEATSNALRPPANEVAAAAASSADTPSGVEGASAMPAGSRSPAPSVAPHNRRGPRRPSPQALQRRERVLGALEHGAGAATAGSAGAPSTAPSASAARQYPPGTMKDKTGELGEVVKALNHDFIPLVDECYDQASASTRRHGGMLALNVSFASAEGVGGIIESVEAAPNNEVHDDDLIECARQSAFSVELPESAVSGRKQAQLTMPLDARLDAGAPLAP